MRKIPPDFSPVGSVGASQPLAERSPPETRAPKTLFAFIVLCEFNFTHRGRYFIKFSRNVFFVRSQS